LCKTSRGPRHPLRTLGFLGHPSLPPELATPLVTPSRHQGFIPSCYQPHSFSLRIRWRITSSPDGAGWTRLSRCSFERLRIDALRSQLSSTSDSRAACSRINWFLRRVASLRAFLPAWFAPVATSYLLWHGQHRQRSSGLGFSGSWCTCAAPRCSVAPHSSQRHPARCLQAVARSFQLAGYVATPLLYPKSAFLCGLG
jgi:hypothetical protein